MEKRNYGSAKRSYNKKESRKDESTDVRTFGGELKPLMTEEEKKDVAKFSHVLRDFRNYIHPYQQMSERFFPDDNTAKICMQVMKGALLQISQYNRA